MGMRLAAVAVSLALVACTPQPSSDSKPTSSAPQSTDGVTPAPTTRTTSIPDGPDATSLPSQDVVITRWVDGDTVDTTAGRVRLLGIDTPEHGRCGFDEATAQAEALAPVGSAARLLRVPDDDDTDRYGRLLRYVWVGSTDVGLSLIESGVAIARYDSRDGYGPHPAEAEYIAADEASANIC